MRTICTLGLILASAPVAAQTQLHVAAGVDSNGSPTREWREILQKRTGDPVYTELLAMSHELTPEELAWDRLIRERRPEWEQMAIPIAGLYDPAVPPQRVIIVTGNFGASDAFVHDPQTIGFDLSVLQNAYGSALLPENTDRVDRLFSHEYAHVMQKAWLSKAPYLPDTPLKHALLDIWLEGLATYHSLSQQWRATPEGYASRARETLAALEPRLLARLAALSCSASDSIPVLTADLSQGRFNEKWGALTAGLWLEAEAARASNRDDALRSFIRAGPAGVWDLAIRQMDPALRSVLREIRGLEDLCDT